ncbi:MAG: hypothetical protein HZB76_05970 [Chlamydiae bacterium]|nr:hypothetical protein [Chlamydiota bacterium]
MSFDRGVFRRFDKYEATDIALFDEYCQEGKAADIEARCNRIVVQRLHELVTQRLRYEELSAWVMDLQYKVEQEIEKHHLPRAIQYARLIIPNRSRSAIFSKIVESYIGKFLNLKTNDFDSAERVALSIYDIEVQRNALLIIAEKYLAYNKISTNPAEPVDFLAVDLSVIGKAVDLLNKAENTLLPDGLPDSPYKDEALSKIVNLYIAVGCLPDAERVANTITSPEYKNIALEAICRANIARNWLTNAERIANTITSPTYKDRVLEAIFDGYIKRLEESHYSKASSLEDAERIAKSMNEKARNKAFLEIVKQHCEASEDKTLNIDNARRVALLITDVDDQSEALKKIINVICEPPRNLALAIEIAISIPNIGSKIEALLVIAENYYKADQDLDTALSILSDLEEIGPDVKSYYFVDIVKSYIKMGRLDEAQRVTKDKLLPIADPQSATRAQEAICHAYLALGNLDKAVEAAVLMPYPASESYYLEKIGNAYLASSLEKAEKLAKVKNVAMLIKIDENRQSLLKAVFYTMFSEVRTLDEIPEVIALANLMLGDNKRSQVEIIISQICRMKLNKAQRAAAAKKVAGLIDIDHRADPLLTIFDKVCDGGLKPDEIDIAVDLANSMPRYDMRNRCLRDIVFTICQYSSEGSGLDKASEIADIIVPPYKQQAFEVIENARRGLPFVDISKDRGH